MVNGLFALKAAAQCVLHDQPMKYLRWPIIYTRAAQVAVSERFPRSRQQAVPEGFCRSESTFNDLFQSVLWPFENRFSGEIVRIGPARQTGSSSGVFQTATTWTGVLLGWHVMKGTR
jgi:hypothetical protein